MTFDRFLLAFSATGLIPIALGYGADPHALLPFLYGFDVSGTNEPHIFRAVMGLYFAQIIFWYLGVAFQVFRQPALYTLMVFMFGLAFGRVLSLIVDGTPNNLLLLYLFLEFLLGNLAVYALLRTLKADKIVSSV
ncbi:DUF4345 domain-containing protein [Roseibium album]|uniref:DUF4345 domain-containing protein n=1 Tax=Roseibium album TaxID=311410 RepID=UPI003BB147BD